jgi:hypothetical protein
MSALSQEEPTLSRAVNQESAEQLCLMQTKRALNLILLSPRLNKLFEENKLRDFKDFSWMTSFKLYITSQRGDLEMSIKFDSDRMFNRPMDGVGLENLPKTLEVYIPKARNFSKIEALEDYFDDVKSFYCEDGDVEKGIQSVINDIINICNAIC